MPIPMVAGGTIAPCRIVKQSAVADAKCLQAAASSDKPAGISQRGTRLTPFSGLDDGNAATAGDSLQVFQDAERAMLELGTGGVAAGDLITSDASGKGVTASAGNYIAAVAIEAGVAGNIVEVMVRIFKI